MSGPVVLTAAELTARAKSYDRKAIDADDAGRPLDPPALDAGRFADEADYAEEHAREALAAEMAALRAAAPPVEPDPDGARLMAEYALYQQQQGPTEAELSADEDFSAFLDASRDAFVDWLSTMGSDPHAARPGVVGVRPSTSPSSPAVSA